MSLQLEDLNSVFGPALWCVTKLLHFVKFFFLLSLIISLSNNNTMVP